MSASKIVLNAGYGNATVTRDGPSITITVSNVSTTVYVASEGDVDILYNLVLLAEASGKMQLKDKVLEAMGMPKTTKKDLFKNEKPNKAIQS